MTPSGTTHVIHDQWDNVLVETNGTGTAVREYIWLGDVPVAVLDGSSTPANPTLLWVYADHLKRPELMLTATRQQVWKATYEPFGTVVAITGAAANNQRLPGQWFQLEAGLAYNWNRHYDASLGRYTQADPLADNRPSPPQPMSSLGREAAPGTSFLTDAPAVSASRLGATALASGITSLLAAREDGVGPTGSLLANPAGAVPRDGPSLYGYARLSPVMWTDRKGLASGNFVAMALAEAAKAAVAMASRPNTASATGNFATIVLLRSSELGMNLQPNERKF